MTIEEGLKLEPNFEIPFHGKKGVDIPGVTRNDFAEFLARNGFKVGVEVGVDRGEYSLVLCKAGCKVTGVDPYVRYDAYKAEGKYESHKDIALKNLKGYNFTLINKYSVDAVNEIPDNSLDFVYIDGNHSLPYAAQDIFLWERKVRKGGILSGHDYAMVRGAREQQPDPVYDGVHVKAAVDTAVYIMRIPKLYILGRRSKWEGEPRDKWRSWFFYKNE